MSSSGKRLQVTSADIVDGTIVNADISSSASIGVEKIHAGGSNEVLVGGVSNAFASLLNTHVSPSAAIELGKIKTAAVGTRKTGVQSIASIPTYTTITFPDGEYFNTSPAGTIAMHSLTTNSSRFYAPMTGCYDIACSLAFETGVANSPFIALTKNGVTGIALAGGAAAISPSHSVVFGSSLAYLSAGDYVEVWASHFAGSAVNTYGDSQIFFMGMIGG